MTALHRIFVPWVAFTLIALLGIGVVVGGTLAVRSVLHARDAERRVCAADLRALKARNPLVERYFMPSEPCRALELLAKGHAR